MIDIYRIPAYKEVNPALFTIITFPLQFGIMFGDIGHGTLHLLCAMALWCIPSLANHKVIRKARYMYLLMALFAIFCGSLYNEVFSIPLNLFGSCYEAQKGEGDGYIGCRKPGCTYPWGIDPAWYRASNELIYINSFKMKFAIITGVSQMIMGIVFSAMNFVYFRNCVDFVFAFIP